MIRRVFVSLILAATLTDRAVADDCPPVGDDAQRVTSGEYTVSFITEPENIVIGEHFGLLVGACEDGAPFAGQITVDADMPGHGHGMNYRPEITPAGKGRVRAGGMMFHMPGEWRFLFTLNGGSGREVLELTRDVR